MICDVAADYFPVNHFHFFHTLQAARITRMLQVLEPEILAVVRSQGASPDDVAFAATFTRACIAQGFAAMYIRAKSIAAHYDPGWAAAQAWPRPLPSRLQSLACFQHVIDGLGGRIFLQNGFEYVATLHIPNSAALAMAHLRLAMNGQFPKTPKGMFSLRMVPLLQRYSSLNTWVLLLVGSTPLKQPFNRDNP